MSATSRRIAGVLVLALVGLTLAPSPPASAQADDPTAAQASREITFTAPDGVEIHTTLTGQGPIEPRPVIVEFSPYGPGTATLDPGPDYNFLLVQIRGTGQSEGSFDALGPQTQRDVADVLDWACTQDWSNGELGLNGFSASAITIYNSLHLDLPCVKSAVLKSGTFELYRDLLYPGGIQNVVPIAVVLGTIGGAAALQGLDHLDEPETILDVLQGQLGSVTNGLEHPTQDGFWLERGFRGDVNDLPILMIGGFYDVESRGAFQAFQELRDDGAHLILAGGHDGVPAGTDGGVATARAWLDRYVQDVPNGVEDEPAVRLLIGDGSYEALQAGRFVRVDATDWPPPDTRWLSLALDPTRSGTARSLNDGTLTTGQPAAAVTDIYPAAPSFPLASDPYNASNLGPSGAFLWNMALVEPLGLSWTTEPFNSDVIAAGPASLELRLSTTAPETGIWVTLSDVAPDGTASPVAAGRLLSAFPNVDDARSLHDPDTGDIVQPYGLFHPKQPASIGEDRLYRVEIWPIGNRFKAGHRLRVHVLGASALYTPTLPAANAVTVGHGSGSRLLFPVLGGADAAVFEGAAPDDPEAPAARADVEGSVGGRLPATGGDLWALFPAAIALVAALVLHAVSNRARGLRRAR